MDMSLVKHQPVINKKKIATVLDEEKYTKSLENIIVRDFFPDHDKLKDQKDYLEAEEKKDYEKMRLLALKNEAGLTSATSNEIVEEDNDSSEQKSSEDYDANDNSPNTNLSLNGFLNNYTSEDNRSFETILKVNEEKHKETHGWLYNERIPGSDVKAITNTVEGEAPVLAIESSDMIAKQGEELETFDSRVAQPADTWKFIAKNHLMYYPEGEDENSEEMFKKPLAVMHKNTRFEKNPFHESLDKYKLAEAAAQNQKFSMGEKVGHDGNLLLPQDTPNVNGYKFVGTPSPSPDQMASPLMTWGVVENTPMRLTSSTPGPSFNFPEESKREKLAQKMIGDNTKKKSDKKKAALLAVRRNVSTTPQSRIGSIERMHLLSPAARKLISSQIRPGSNDRSLKASYTPKRTGSLTPLAKTPKLHRTPKSTPTPNPTTSSITDDLLNISNIKTKRKKASDFFT